MRLALAVTLMLAATPAFSQMRTDTPDSGTLFIDLPHGQVSVTLNTVENYGFWVRAAGAQEIGIPGAHMPQWLETHENSALLRLNMGTAFCSASHVWITYDAEGLRTTDEFGTCSFDGVYAVTKDGPTYAMEGRSDNEADAVFLFDAASNTVTTLP